MDDFVAFLIMLFVPVLIVYGLGVFVTFDPGWLIASQEVRAIATFCFVLWSAAIMGAAAS